jgi:hypothetical protein
MAYTDQRNVIPLGSKDGKFQSVVEIGAQAAADKPGILSLVAVDDTGVRTPYYYWTDSNGVLRKHTSIPTNQDSDGSAVVASDAADTALSNLAAVAINTSLVSDTANTDDLGSDPLSWRTVYWTTSLKKIGTTWDVTLAATEPAAASYTYTFPDAGASANVMLDTGAANVIAYTKGTSTINFGANADLDIAAGITVNIDTALTVNTESITLNQSLSTTDDVTFGSITSTTTNAAAIGLTIAGPQAQTAPMLKLDPTTGTGWVGAAGVGMIQITHDTALAATDAAQVLLTASDAIDDSRGHCLRIVDSSNVTGTMGYPVYIASNDATMGGVYISTNAAGAALTVAAGTASFAGLVTCTAGLKTKVATTDVEDPPTQANMVTAFGAAATAGAGFMGVINDANGGTNVWLCVSDGTNWFYAAKLTVGAS